MKKDTWLITANASMARIYRICPKQMLEEIAILEHPASRLYNRDLVSDQQGRSYESANSSRHSIEPKTTPKDNEFHYFAKSLADHLESACNHKEFDKLYIAASPTLLGLLRRSLHANTAKHICGEVDKDLTQMKADEITKHVPFLFYAHA